MKIPKYLVKHVLFFHSPFGRLIFLSISVFSLFVGINHFSKNNIDTGIIFILSSLMWIINFVSYRDLTREEKIRRLTGVKND